MNAAMSAIGTKRTCASALHMSAFGGKADTAYLVVPSHLRSRPGPLTGLGALDLLGWNWISAVITPEVRLVELAVAVRPYRGEPRFLAAAVGSTPDVRRSAIQDRGTGSWP